MKKIIGGLLVLSLLTSPYMKVDIIAYEVYKSQNQIISYVKKYSSQEDAEDEISPVKVEGLMNEIERNNRSINSLLKSNREVIASVHEAVAIKSRTNEKLTEEQMVVYKEFSDYYNKELNDLNRTLSQISDKDVMSKVKSEICSTETDYSGLYNELKGISDNQYNALFNLNGIRSKGEQTLAVL